MIPSTTPDKLGARVVEAVKNLPDIAAAEFPKALIDRVTSELPTQRAVDAALARLNSVARANAAYAERGVDRTAEGKPLPRLNVQYHLIGLTDCVGEKDPETTARIAVEELGRLERIGVPDTRLNWLQTEPLNPVALGAAVSSVYYTQVQRQEREPEYRGQLVILGNSAPRTPDNPSAKGCPFVLALLDGDVWYLGTFNHGGTELAPVKAHVKEIWRTTLGVEEQGTKNGKEPKAVFRSQHLLALFEGLVTGNDRLLLDMIDPDQGIMVSKELATRGPDSFQNIKLNTSFAELKERHGFEFGDRIVVSIRGIATRARVAKSHGDGRQGELLLVPGSSPLSGGDTTLTGADLVINNGKAFDLFVRLGLATNGPMAGLPVTISREPDSSEQQTRREEAWYL
ncbi:MAG: hypothetical protein EBZ48_02325 [Proteobacteria bacterium]|nr:hypothetical protein [Pseudomonadota bacterium]